MKKCENCIHYALCPGLDYDNNHPYKDGYSYYCQNYSKFKDKSRIFELPCSICDKAYYITYIINSYKLVEVKVIGFNIDIRETWRVVCKLGANQFELPIDTVYFSKLQAEKEIDRLNRKLCVRDGVSLVEDVIHSRELSDLSKMEDKK